MSSNKLLELKSRMKYIRYILAVKPSLNIFLLLTILCLVVMESYLLNIPEVVPWGAEFGKVFYKLCLSFIASYIFYFVVVHIKSESDKEQINGFISSKVDRVIGDCKSQINDFKRQVNYESAEIYLTLEEIEEVFSKINPHSNAPLLLGGLENHANWMQYMIRHKNRSQEAIQKIFVKMPFLDSKLVRILAEIDGCTHFDIVETSLGLGFSNKDLKAWGSTFHKYTVLCQQLESHKLKYLA